MEIWNGGTRSNIFLGQLLESSALSTRLTSPLRSRTGGSDHLVNRAIVDRWQEPVKGLSDAQEQPELHRPLFDTGAGLEVQIC